MSDRIQHGRIEKSPSKPWQSDYSLQKKAFFRPKKAYTFRPTEHNRRLIPENKERYFFNFGEWRGSAIGELVYDQSGKRYILAFVLGDKFDLESRLDLITAFRSLDLDFYSDHWCVGQRVLDRGFTRTWRDGSHYYYQPLSKDMTVGLSCDETQYDQFIHAYSHGLSHWTSSFSREGEMGPDVTLDTATFDETVFSQLDKAEREDLARFPVHISFHGMPIRLERLFIDDPDKKATYLTIQPFGFHSSTGRGNHFYLTMRLDEEGQDEDWAEKLLGLPYHFFGAYVNSQTEDLTCAHFKPIEVTEIESGFRFEASGNVVLSEGGRACIELDWGTYSMFRAYGSRRHESLKSLPLRYSQEELDLPGGPCHMRGIITLQDNQKFDNREERLEDAVWRCCAFEPEGTT